MNKISELFNLYGSDKNEGVFFPNESGRGHTYGKSYDKIFEKFEKDSNLNILEIGIQRGGSLLAYYDFFKNSTLYGVDIVDSILEEYKKDDITYIFEDIKSDKTSNILKDVSFDIIIDDGSHFLSDVLFTVENYLGKLKSGGVLVIEDCQHPEVWLDEIKKYVDDQHSIVVADLRFERTGEQYDNFLIIIEKI